MSPLRRGAAALTAAAFAATLAALSTPAAQAAPSPSPSAPVNADPALYGTGDPTYDGVWRQSFTLLALDTAGVKPSGSAVKWLVGQQCEDGGWASFRADVDKRCDTKTEDTNATAAAVQALAALGGHGGPVDRAVDWLVKVQNTDGGWSYNPGAPSDANSTAIVTGALAAAGEKPDSVAKGGKSPFDALSSLQLGCDAPAAERGAFAYQPDKKGELYANDSATAAAVLAALGKGLPVRAGKSAKDGAAPNVPACEGDVKAVPREKSASAGAAYLAARLDKGGQHLLSPQEGAGPDFATTADAATALAAGGHLAPARKAVSWLQKESAAWSKGQPAALADLILASTATGGDPRDFGGADLVKQLANLGPEPVSLGDAGKSAKDGGEEQAASEDDKADEGDEGGLSVWYTVGLGLLIGIGGGYLISLRKKQG